MSHSLNHAEIGSKMGLPPRQPRCFPDYRTFVVWMAAARHTGGCFDTGICTDCTPEYKARMMAERRCEHPEIRFEIDQDGFQQGVV